VSLGPDGFDAIVWLDPPILVSRRAAKTYEVRVGDRPMTLSLPLRGPDALSMDEGQSWRPIPDFPPPPLAEQLTSGVHMQLQSSAKLPEKPLIVEAVRLRWTDRKMTRKVQTETFWDLDKDFGPWLALVRDWLNAWMGGVRGPVAVEATPRVRIASSAYGGPVGGGGFAQGGVYLGSRRVARPSELRAAFAAASDGVELPVERQLLAEALAYAWGGQARHAVISACSAAEVALSKSADRLLSEAGRTNKERKEITKRINGLVEAYRLNGTLKGGLPVSFGHAIKHLADPRNAAAHEGAEPNEETVTEAIKTAKALLDALSPLRSPRTFRPAV
jgi:hypothetical protein